MSEMIERVARRIDPIAWAQKDLAMARGCSTPHDTDVAFSLARAIEAIEEMREPTDAMRATAARVVPAHELADGDDMVSAYRAMIDAALVPPHG